MGCVPTPVRQSRGGRTARVKCKCGNGSASLGHIVQNCPITHGLRVHRHDDVTKYLFHCWRKRNKYIDVVREPRLETSVGLQKPDLLVVDKESVYVVDVQIRADSKGGNLDAFHTAKCAKYNNPVLSKALQDKYEGKAVQVFSVTFTWRGAMSHLSYETLRSSGLIKNHYVGTLGYQICRSTAKMVTAYWCAPGSFIPPVSNKSGNTN